MEELLRKRYTDPSAPGSFQGPEKLYTSAKKAGQANVSRKDVSKYLEKEDTYTLNRALNNKFPRNRVVVQGIDSQWDMDLMDLSLLEKDNVGNKYVLLAIDIFSRYVWLRPLKSKHAKVVVSALDTVLSEGRQPRSIRTDGGSEFQNKLMKSYLEERGIHIFHTFNDKQANYGERAIKTIKSKLYRYLISRNTLNYLEVLQDLVKSYNNTVHSSLGRPPSNVNKGNESEVRLDQYLLRRRPRLHRYKQHIRFNIGDQVRVSYRREPFDREYGQRWSREIFVIAEGRMRVGIPVYKLNDWNGDPIKGTFYQAQLQKVTAHEDNSFKIEKILRRRRRKGKTQLFVSWKGWPAKFNQWVGENEVTSL